MVAPLLKLELEGELDGAGAADLVEGVEAAIGAAGAQAACQRLRRVAEQGAGQAVVGIAEVGVVEDVEELGLKTKPHLLSKMKLALQRYIRLRSSETAQHVAPENALLPGGGGIKAALLKILPPGYWEA
jgi:hypothetical protein